MMLVKTSIVTNVRSDTTAYDIVQHNNHNIINTQLYKTVMIICNKQQLDFTLSQFHRVHLSPQTRFPEYMQERHHIPL